MAATYLLTDVTPHPTYVIQRCLPAVTMLGMVLFTEMPRCFAVAGNATAPAAPSVSTTSASTVSPTASNLTTISQSAKGLRFAKAPDQAKQAAQEQLRRISNRLSISPDAEIESPVVIYQGVLAGRFITNGDLDAATKPAAYFFPVTENGKPRGAVRITVPEGSAGFAGGAFLPSPTPPIMDAVRQVAELREVRDGSFEVRELQWGPPATASVLWLKSATPNTDLIYAFNRNGGSQPIFTVGRLYTLAEFVAMFRDADIHRQAAAKPPATPQPSPAQN